MGKTYSRDIEIERADVDLETGKVRSIPIFTGGKASDGHILNVLGAEKVKDMPWFVQHEADPRTQIGTLFKQRVEGNALVYDGDILTEGVGAEAEVRRDLLLKIARGIVKRLSGRWEANPKDVTPRTELPTDHPAYINPKKATWAEAQGLYFHKWRPMEGSLVGLGADQDAQLREWAEDQSVSEAVRSFYRSQIKRDDEKIDEQRPDPSSYDSKEDFMSDCVPMVIDEGKSQEQAVAQCNAMWDGKSAGDAGEQHENDPKPVGTHVFETPQGETIKHVDYSDGTCREFHIEPEEPEKLKDHKVAVEAEQAAAVAAIREDFQRARDLGLEMPEILREVGAVVESVEDLGADPPSGPESREELLEKVNSLEERLAALETPAIDEGRVEEAPPASPERVEADPLSADKPLEALKRKAAIGNPKLQAALLKAARVERVNFRELAEELRRGLQEDRDAVVHQFLDEIERRRGKVTT
jgi:hypothetical protein